MDENQKKITDFFSHATKDESLDSLARSLARRSELEKQPKKKSNTGHTPPINKEDLGEKQSETVKKGKKSKVEKNNLESCFEAERRYEPVAAGKPNPKSINIDPELKNSPPSQLSQPSRSKSNKAKIFVAGGSVVKDVKGWLLSREKYVKVYSFCRADTEDMSDFIKPLIN